MAVRPTARTPPAKAVVAKQIDTRRRRRRSPSPASHPCPECGRKFSEPWNLKTHRRIHTGICPYPCRFGCGLQLMWMSSRKSHEAQCTANPDAKASSETKRKSKSPNSRGCPAPAERKEGARNSPCASSSPGVSNFPCLSGILSASGSPNESTSPSGVSIDLHTPKSARSLPDSTLVSPGSSASSLSSILSVDEVPAGYVGPGFDSQKLPPLLEFPSFNYVAYQQPYHAHPAPPPTQAVGTLPGVFELGQKLPDVPGPLDIFQNPSVFSSLSRLDDFGREKDHMHELGQKVVNIPSLPEVGTSLHELGTVPFSSGYPWC